uniref:Evolutionarily conserved signaling intermediate in Toll pathway, mitochondrial n=1 Tax=Mola mola TaxID=94237 RepID=A0A3Q3X7W6_MOLML
MTCARCLLQLQGLRLHQLSMATKVGKQSHSVSIKCKVFCVKALLHVTEIISYAKNRPVLTELTNEGDKKRDKSAVTDVDLFEQLAGDAKTKATFNKVVDVFIKRDVRRRGHVEFIYAALKKMPEFGVERDLVIYNKLLDVFPKEVFVPRNFIQRLMPSVETKVLLVQIFGEKSHPMRKYQRIMYWFPKFKHINPFPIPQQLPENPVDLAHYSLTRIANDRDAEVTVYQSGEQVTLPHVVGIQSLSQMELLAKHNPNRPVFVEGPFPLWLRKTCVYYYILRADPTTPGEKVEESYDERCLEYPLQLDLDLDRDLWDDESFDVEDLDEGPIFAMCMTSQGDQATLNQWISGLQQNNPILGQVPTLLLLDAGSKRATDSESGHQHSTNPDNQREEREPEEEPEVLVIEKPGRSQRMKQ